MKCMRSCFTICRFIASESLDIKVFSTYDAVPATDALMSPGARRPVGSPVRAAGGVSVEMKLDDDPLEALRAALRRAALSGATKQDVLAIVNGLFV